ncbi:hypothetical protein L3V82_08820 [Thiotrichales bacterium 19S3-7]|nr:hypothetical protein [Thiotrichales bacterium 19S3-7]MCF6802178.1 hypothetical protein [Thiotrichales bacterium 19S3-11]
MLERYIIKVSQAIENQSIEDAFEYLLQIGLVISSDQLVKYQKQSQQTINAPTLDEVVKLYLSELSIDDYDIPKSYSLYIAALYEQISERYHLAVAYEDNFAIKTFFAPIKIGLMFYQSVFDIELSADIYDDNHFDYLTQQVDQLINRKHNLNNALNCSGINPVSSEYYDCDIGQLKKFSEAVQQVETMSLELVKQVTSMDQCELLQRIYSYKNLLYPLISYYCISAITENERLGVSASIISLNQWFQSTFSEYKKSQWLYFPLSLFYQIHGAAKLVDTNQNEIKNLLELT